MGINGEGALLNPNPDNDTLVVYWFDPKTGYIKMLSCDQIEIKYGKDGKPEYLIITDPIIALAAQGWK